MQGLSIIKPPYSVLAAIDLDKGAIKWRTPHGETPDAVRNHPLLKGMNIPRTGTRRPILLSTVNPRSPTPAARQASHVEPTSR